MSLNNTVITGCSVVRRHRFPDICLPVKRPRLIQKIINHEKLSALASGILTLHKSAAVLTLPPTSTYKKQKLIHMVTLQHFA